MPLEPPPGRGGVPARAATWVLVVLSAALMVGATGVVLRQPGHADPRHPRPAAAPPSGSSQPSGPPPPGGAAPHRSGPGTLVALGDSVPAGYACDCPAFPQEVADQLDGRLRARNLARSGQTTLGLLDQLSEPQTQQAVRGAAAVVVTIGANDFDEQLADDPRCGDPTACYADDLDALAPALDRVLARLRALAPPHVPLVVTGYWNAFRDGRVAAGRGAAYVAASDALTREVNRRIARSAAGAGGSYVDLYHLFTRDGDDSDLLAPDGDHPNSRGHRVIADEVARVLAPLLD